jgi:hypothetical protein
MKMRTRKSVEETLKEEYEMHPSERQVAKDDAIFNRRSDHELAIIAQAKYLQTVIAFFIEGAVTLTELRNHFAEFLDSTLGE